MEVFIVCICAVLIHTIMLCIKNVISRNLPNKTDFDGGVVFGVVFSFVFLLEVLLLSNVLKTPTPTAMDVYQGKTTIEYTIRDGEVIDSVVVFRK